MTAVPLPAVAAPDRFDLASDWCNPILVKEVRQALKSRVFLGTFSLLLFGSWLIAAFYIVTQGNTIEYGQLGGELFNWYLGVLCAAMFIVIPFNAFRSLINEREENTYELLSITTLSPGQIVRGKWACAMVQGGLFYSAVAPFIAFSSLLQGFDFAQAAFMLVLTFYVSSGICLLTLLIGTTVQQRVWQGIVSFLLLCGLLWAGSVLFFTGFAGGDSLPLDEPNFWWVVAIAGTMWASYMLLFYQIATARLTFEAENRSTGIRLTAAAQFWLLWLGMAAFHLFGGEPIDSDEIIALILFSAAHWAFCGLAFAAEPDGLSRRVRRDIPRPAWLRPFVAPLLPGGARGYLFVLLHLAVLWLVGTLGWAASDGGGFGLFGSGRVAPGEFAGRWAGILLFDSESWNDVAVPMATVVCLYIVFYAGLVGIVRRLFSRLSPSFGSAHARTVVVILLAMGVVVPMGLRSADVIRWNDVSALDVVFPFWVVAEVMGRDQTAVQLLLIAMAALAVLAANVPAIIRGMAMVQAGPWLAPRRPARTASVPDFDVAAAAADFAPPPADGRLSPEVAGAAARAPGN